MIETKWTPGPWTTVRLKDGDFDSYVVGHKRGGIAKMILCSDYQKETADANARLIAAAPELYEALEGMVACYQAQPQSEKDAELSARKLNAWMASIKALAKARGETP